MYEYVYDNLNDIYCYPNTSILKNKFNIRELSGLNIAERQITSLKIAELERNPIKGSFDLFHLKDIHRYIFCDIYDWAGDIRKGDFLIKGNSIFCRAGFIENMAEDIHKGLIKENYLKGLKKQLFIERLAYLTNCETRRVDAL